MSGAAALLHHGKVGASTPSETSGTRRTNSFSHR